MKYKLSAGFTFLNGDTQGVKWTEKDLNKQGTDGKGGVTEVPLTVEEVEMHFRNVFLTYLKNKDIMSIPTDEGSIAFIPFEQVLRMELSVWGDDSNV